jgi:hypothetical protein
MLDFGTIYSVSVVFIFCVIDNQGIIRCKLQLGHVQCYYMNVICATGMIIIGFKKVLSSN